jgi:hypothetical protein
VCDIVVMKRNSAFASGRPHVQMIATVVCTHNTEVVPGVTC